MSCPKYLSISSLVEYENTPVYKGSYFICEFLY